VKELRLQDGSSIQSANASMVAFIELYNARSRGSTKRLRRASRGEDSEELDLIFAWRELRKITWSLTLLRAQVVSPKYPATRRLIGPTISAAAARINAAEAAIYGEIAALDVHESDEGVVAIDYCCRDDPYIREICL